MNVKLLTRKELEKSWWWRREKFRRARKGVGASGVSFDYSDDSSKRIALNYELLRRSPEGKQFGKAYFELNRDEISICSKLWAALPDAPCRLAVNDVQKAERGWYAFDPRIQWNLRLNPSALQAAFMREINLQCQVQKIRSRRHLKGKINRRMSWDCVEILDRHQNKVGKLTASQRHTASAARVKALKCFREFNHALAKWHRDGKDNSETMSEAAENSYR